MRLFARKRISPLDAPIKAVLDEMKTFGPDSPEYPKLVAHLESLTRLKAEERHSRVSADTLAIVLGNLAGILVIVAYEQRHVMASKGMGFILKPKN